MHVQLEPCKKLGSKAGNPKSLISAAEIVSPPAPGASCVGGRVVPRQSAQQSVVHPLQLELRAPCSGDMEAADGFVSDALRPRIQFLVLQDSEWITAVVGLG